MSTVNTTKIPFRGIFFSTYIYIYLYKALLDISILILEETITQLN